MDPLFFHPVIRSALWGGRRLEQEFGKPTDGRQNVGESWEISDLPGAVSVVSRGPWAGTTLRELMESRAEDLLGRHADCRCFPLLAKLIDAQHNLSVQVHPRESEVLSKDETHLSKAEAWIVISAAANSRMYLGLRPGVSEADLRRAIANGGMEECLNVVTPRSGDCVFLGPGTLHALGGGILIAEIQQRSDTTFRLYDWDRTDSAGRPRTLHIERALKAVDFSLGPIAPVRPQPLPGCPFGEELVATKFFVLRRYRGASTCGMIEDERMHILMLLAGNAELVTQNGQRAGELHPGQTVLLPARREAVNVDLSANATLLDVFLPDHFEPPEFW